MERLLVFSIMLLDVPFARNSFEEVDGMGDVVWCVHLFWNVPYLFYANDGKSYQMHVSMETKSYLFYFVIKSAVTMGVEALQCLIR